MPRKEDIVLIISTCIFVFLIFTMTGCSTLPKFEGDDTRYKYTDCILDNIQDTTINNVHEYCEEKDAR